MIPNIVLRTAKIISISSLSGTCEIKFTDRGIDEFATSCLLSNPLATNGTGVYVEPSVDSNVLIGFGWMGQPYVMGYLPNPSFESLFTQNNNINLNSSFLAKPNGLPGETFIKGFKNTYMHFSTNGAINSKFGTSVSLQSSDDIVTLKTSDRYESLQSHYSVSGVVKRERGVQEQLVTDEKLTSLLFEDGLYEVGRKPDLSIGLKSSSDKRGSTLKRNPPFVETRNVHYEFARDFSAGNPSYEEELFSAASQELYSLNTQRQGARTDSFGLGPLQYNLLSENLIGTAVDLYGNVLDINRSKIDLKALEPDNVNGLYSALRKSTKYHFEMNSRKSDGVISSNDSKGVFEDSPAIYANHSRLFVDVDGEGQVKINVPASSPVGNIPVHARYLSGDYFNTENENDFALYSNRLDSEGAIDINLLNYSTTTGGIEVIGAPDSRSKKFFWNMPYHDFTFLDILEKKNYFYPGTIYGTLTPQSSSSYAALLGGITLGQTSLFKVLSATSLSNGQEPNAGGRSVHANLDGSVELSIGMDQSDNKSLTLDSAGSGIMRFGKDLNGNSLVVAADGSVSMIVGASTRADSTTTSEGANFQIFVEGTTGVSSVQIINGTIVVTSAPQKGMILKSAGNLVLDSAKDLLINAERIFAFGKYDQDGNTLAPEREIIRNGSKQV